MKLRQRGKKLREAAVANATESGSTQKKARGERGFNDEIDAGPSAGTASRSDGPPLPGPSPPNPDPEYSEMT